MRNIVMWISYDGTRYSGFQRQENTDNTIEEKLTRVISQVTGDVVEIHGSGRTDAGVHARKQVINFKTDCNDLLEEMMAKANLYLPEDIRITKCFEENIRFHSRLLAKEKIYKYTIDNNSVMDVFARKYAIFHPGELDIEYMRLVSEIFIGEKDFRSFTDMKGKKSAVRKINSIDITKSNGIIEITYSGNGFLYHMVRIITEYLIKCGEHEIDREYVLNRLNKLKRDKSFGLAPSKGLMLFDVKY